MSIRCRRSEKKSKNLRKRGGKVDRRSKTESPRPPTRGARPWSSANGRALHSRDRGVKGPLQHDFAIVLDVSPSLDSQNTSKSDKTKFTNVRNEESFATV